MMETPASGKSTVAKALMQRFEKACTFRRITCVRWLCRAYRIWVLKFHPPPYSSCAWLEKPPQAWHKMIRTTNLQLPQMTFGYSETQTGYRRKKLVNASHGSCCFLNLATTSKCLHPRNPEEASFKHMLEQAGRQLYPEIQAHPKTNWLVIDSSSYSVKNPQIVF
jgi:hypothetical protein